MTTFTDVRADGAQKRFFFPKPLSSSYLWTITTDWKKTTCKIKTKIYFDIKNKTYCTSYKTLLMRFIGNVDEVGLDLAKKQNKSIGKAMGDGKLVFFLSKTKEKKRWFVQLDALEIFII